MPPLGVVTGSLILAAVIYAPFAAWRRPAHFTADASWSVLGLAIICTAAAFLVFFALISEVGPARATVITYINPAVAILLGVTLLDEPLTIGMGIGFPLVILGSILGTARTRAAEQPDSTPVPQSPSQV
ncbi:EamA family transporter [Nocardia sp. CA-119907]|uniref:EamA family transporter n=1 Tax=Nocardia sp. CA-119907 TaxID=3239973 RepID=UPI003D96D7AB